MKPSRQLLRAARRKEKKDSQRGSLSAFDAVGPLKAHFAKVLKGETITEPELLQFTSAAKAIAHTPLALGHFGLAMIELLLAHYDRQLAQMEQQQ